MSKLRAKEIKLLLFDVDGVLTDGKLFIFPVPAGALQTTQEHAAKHGGQGGFGLVSQTMHKADERVEIADITQLTAIYEVFLDRFFATG